VVNLVGRSDFYRRSISSWTLCPSYFPHVSLMRVFPMNYFVKSYKVSIRVFFFRCVLSSIFGEDNIGKLVFRFWERNGRDTVVRDKG